MGKFFQNGINLAGIQVTLVVLEDIYFRKLPVVKQGRHLHSRYISKQHALGEEKK